MRSRLLCSRCGPRLALAARHGGVLNAPNGTLIIDAQAELAAISARRRESNNDATSTAPNPVVIAIWLLSVLVIMAFGVLATFSSPLFFLGVMVTFIPLAVVAIRSA